MAYLCSQCLRPRQEDSLAWGNLMARGWNHREASFLTCLGLMLAVSWDLCVRRPLRGSSWVAGLLRLWPGSEVLKDSVPEHKAEAVLPVLTQPWRSGNATPLHSAGYKQVTHLPRFKGRGVKVSLWTRKYCWGHLSEKAIHHMVFTHYRLCPDHHPHSNLTTC